MLRCLLWLLLLFVAASAQAAEVRAWLDRTDIALGETVTLNIEVQGTGVSQPALDVLQRDFDVLGTSSSSQISIVNGQRSATTIYAVALQARSEGVFSVPAIAVAGSMTSPLSLTVRPSPVSNGAGGDIFLEATVSPVDPYVQQQSIYALKLFYAVTVLDGQLDAPQPDGARVVRLGDDLKYQVERDGRRYVVIERRFAVIPERSGDLALDAPRFEGRGLDRGGLGGMFGGGLRLSARGEPLQLRVRPRPAAGGDPWLPAQSLQIETGGSTLPDEVEVGQPLTLPVLIRARGLAPEQLPELVLPPIDGAAIYPDQESTRDRSTSDGLAGERSRRFAIVPQRAGELEIPALRIRWWNVERDAEEVAELPARRVRVVGGAASAPPPVAPAASPASSADEPAVVPDAAAATTVWWLQAGPWMLLSAVLAAGLIVSLRRPRAAVAALPVRQPETPVAAVLPQLKVALRGADLSILAAVLRASASPPLVSLEALAERLAEPAQRDAVRALERHLYAGEGDAATLREQLRRAFERGIRWQPAAAKPRDGEAELPPLYR